MWEKLSGGFPDWVQVKRSGIFQLALVMPLAAISDAHSGAKRSENTSDVQETNMRLRQGQELL